MRIGMELATRAPHRPGATGRARRMRRGATLPERLLWEELRQLALNFRRQAPIGRFVVDFVHHGGRLIVELDGPVHELFGGGDVERDAWLRSQGYRVLRFKNEEVMADVQGIADRLGREVAKGRKPSPLPLDGGEAGRGGVRATGDEIAREEESSFSASPSKVLATPPTPTLPPSRGKGAD